MDENENELKELIKEFEERLVPLLRKKIKRQCFRYKARFRHILSDKMSEFGDDMSNYLDAIDVYLKLQKLWSKPCYF